MQRYILIRLFHGLIAFLGVTILIFSLVRLSGDPLDNLLSEEDDEETAQYVRQLWGLDRPLAVQYFTYMGNVLQGEFGPSFSFDASAGELIKRRLPNTLLLGGLATAISFPLSIAIGVFTAVRRDSFLDYGGKSLAIVGQATPDFWIAIILIWIFAVTLGWLPTSGKGEIDHLVLPVIVLALPSAATLRLMRSAMLNQLDSEYVKLARIKGLPEWKIIWKHAFRNAAIVPLTFMSVIIAQLVSGSIVVETIFAWPGMGQLAIQAINARDYHVVQALALMGSTILILMHLVTDIAYVYADPRIRFTRINR
ncbi:MAG: ABC transporter permease [Chloroflexota bacterium]|nr:ABC transporter permease [Chloroflexota bacterium]MDE2968592.1 ABC transporter permease [Chloroflexota bacterium]